MVSERSLLSSWPSPREKDPEEIYCQNEERYVKELGPVGIYRLDKKTGKQIPLELMWRFEKDEKIWYKKILIYGYKWIGSMSDFSYLRKMTLFYGAALRNLLLANEVGSWVR